MWIRLILHIGPHRGCLALRLSSYKQSVGNINDHQGGQRKCMAGKGQERTSTLSRYPRASEYNNL
jgi:hypothetical protein